MKEVSEVYQEQMALPLRNRSFVRVTLRDSNREAESNAELDWSTSLFTGGSPTRILGETPYGPTAVTVEHNRWLLDGGTQKYFATNSAEWNQNGYASYATATAIGEYATDPYVEVTFTEAQTLTGFTVVFDTRLNTWPVKCAIHIYNDGTEVYSETFTGLEEPRAVVDRLVTCDRIEVVCEESLPLTHFRVEQIVLGLTRVFDGRVLVGTEQTNDVDPLSRRLPQEDFSFTILDYAGEFDPENPIGIWRYMSEKDPVEVSFGYELVDEETGESVIEWLTPDKYILTSKPETHNHQATFTATGMLGIMTGQYYKDTVGEKTLYDMAVAILEDAGLPMMNDGSDPWVVDESLQNLTTTGILPIGTHATCLQMVAHAGRCYLFTDDDNKIHVEPFVIPDTSGDPVFDLSFDSILEESQASTQIAQLKAVVVSNYSHSVAEESSVLYSAETDETTLHVEFSQPAADVTVSVTGGTVTAQHIYAQAVDLTMSAGTKTVEISGKPLTEVKTVSTTNVNATGDVDEEDNPLCGDTGLGAALATHARNYLALRTTYEMDYRGNPELETKDYISVQTRYADRMPALVLKNRISYNGALHGSVTVKGLTNA